MNPPCFPCQTGILPVGLGYDEGMRNRVVTATEFKAHCLALLDDVNDCGDTVTVTKRGRPVAILRPVKKKPWKSPQGALVGKIKIVGDIVNFETTDLWECLHENAEDILR